MKEETGGVSKKTKRTVKKKREGSKMKANNVERPVSGQGQGHPDSTEKSPETMESQGVQGEAASATTGHPPIVPLDPNQDKSTAILEVNRDEALENAQNSSAHKSTETKASIPETPPEDNTTRREESAEQRWKSDADIIKCSDTATYQDQQNGRINIDQILITDDDDDELYELRIIRADDKETKNAGRGEDGEKQLEAQVTSAVNWAMNGSSSADHKTLRSAGNKESCKQHVMVTRKRAKENQQEEVVITNGGGALTAVVENTAATASPEKKVRRTSSVPFRKKKSGGITK